MGQKETKKTEETKRIMLSKKWREKKRKKSVKGVGKGNQGVKWGGVEWSGVEWNAGVE